MNNNADALLFTRSVEAPQTLGSHRRIRLREILLACLRAKRFDMRVKMIIRIDFEQKTVQKDSDSLQYCFPGREFVLSGEKCHLRCRFGYTYPLPFVTVLDDKKGTTLIAHDPVFDEIELLRDDTGIHVLLRYDIPDTRQNREKAEKGILRIEHERDFHAGFETYRKWYAEKIDDRKSAMSEKLKNCFYLRRYFFNRDLCRCHVLDKSGNIRLEKIYNDDCLEAGGIDAALLFDYAYDPVKRTRCGNTDPLPFGEKALGDLNRQIGQIREKGCGTVFCYFEPYLIDAGSDWDLSMSEEGRRPGQITDEYGSPVILWRLDQWAPCLADRKWRRIGADYLREVTRQFDCDGIYLDEFGNGTQYVCRAPGHEHGKLSQLQMEKQYHEQLRSEVPAQLWMSEYPVPYTMVSDFDAVLSDTRTVVNAYRFAHPRIRFIRIIGTDRPVGDNLYDVNKSFFNGEGLWIDNDLHDPVWYSERVKDAIRRQYSVRHRYREFFSSADVIPLYPIESENILCNAFICGSVRLLTLINPSEAEEKAVIRIREDEEIYDVFRERKATVKKDGRGKSLVEQTLGPHDVAGLLVSRRREGGRLY